MQSSLLAGKKKRDAPSPTKSDQEFALMLGLDAPFPLSYSRKKSL